MFCLFGNWYESNMGKKLQLELILLCMRLRVVDDLKPGDFRGTSKSNDIDLYPQFRPIKITKLHDQRDTDDIMGIYYWYSDGNGDIFRERFGDIMFWLVVWNHGIL
jgi:hypothetical protein